MGNDNPMSPSETVFRSRFPDHLEQCHARSKQTGDRCGQPAIKGGTVCPWHGGGSPNVKARANLRLLQLVDPALSRLATIINDGDDDVAVRAANSILDRAGIVRRADIDPAAATALLIERLREMRDAHTVVEGEVIPDALT